MKYVFSGKNNTSTKSYNRQTYQDYEQPCERSLKSDF